MANIEIACFMNRSGYAQASQDYIYALLNDHKHDISIFLINNIIEKFTCTEKRYKELTDLSLKKRKNDIQIVHCVPEMQRRITKNGKRIGFATYETLNPPKMWVSILNSNDAVACPSMFNVNIFKDSGVNVPIHYIPHCIDTSMWNIDVKPREKRDKFTFLFFGAWRKRKGWEKLIEAFFKEFDKNDNVQLLIKTDKILYSQRDISKLKENLNLQTKETAPIIYETKILNEEELPSFMKSVDCLIIPTMGEGFCLPGLQSLSLGIPIIITNYSGCCEYANDKTSLLLEPDGFVLMDDMDQIAQFNNKKWANITVDSIRKAMRQIISNYDIEKSKAIFGSTFVSNNYNYNIAANSINKMIESLL